VSNVLPQDLCRWCRIPAGELESHPDRRVPFRLIRDSNEMGQLMAAELAGVIESNNRQGSPTRAIIPCGPNCWYEPWTALVNARSLSLRNLFVFHMDECLDWQGRALPRNHPYNFRTFMEKHFYGEIAAGLNVPESQRFWLSPETVAHVRSALDAAPVDLTLGGWGQDGHVAYNQTRRNPFSHITLEELAHSTIRIQENNLDTIQALAHVDYPRDARMPRREADSRVQRHGSLEANCPTCGAVFRAYAGVSHHALAATSRCFDYGDTRHCASSNRRESGLGTAVKWNADSPYLGLMGVGGIGTGLFFALEGDHTLGRNESRPARRLDVRDCCKLHVIAHYVAVLLGAGAGADCFHVLPIGRVGDDDPGCSMIGEMALAGMDIRDVLKVKDRPTTFSVCFQYPDGSGGNITTIDSAAMALTSAEIDTAMTHLRGSVGRYIALAAPEVPMQARQHLLRRASAGGALRVACLTSEEAISEEREELLQFADLVAINEDEAGALIGQTFPAGTVDPFLDRCACVLQSYNRKVRILLSAGGRGAFAFDGHSWDHHPAHHVRVSSSAGAGDALLAGVLSGLAAGAPFILPRKSRMAADEDRVESALDLGVLTASFSVTSPHTIHPEADLKTLIAFADRLHLRFSGELARFLGSRPTSGRRPVSGCTG